MGAPLAGITPIFALYFLGFDKGKDIAKEIGGPLSKVVSLPATNHNADISKRHLL